MMEQAKLIVFPFAGGNSNSFKRLESLLSDTMNVEFYCIEYPGRGRRMSEQLIDNLDELVDDLYEKYKHWLVGEFYFLGYSMGALVAQLMTRKLNKSSSVLPKMNIVMACRSPRFIASNSNKIGHLPAEEFIQQIVNFGGVDEEIRAHEGMLEFFTPILRSDYKAYEGYQLGNQSPVPVPIHVFGGDKDDIQVEELKAWQEETDHGIEISLYDGGHFFLFDQLEGVTRELQTIINKG